MDIIGVAGTAGDLLHTLNARLRAADHRQGSIGVPRRQTGCFHNLEFIFGVFAVAEFIDV
jgi:hypothetical protein